MMNESSSNKDIAKLRPHMWDRQKDASVQSDKKTPQGHAVQWDRFLPFRSFMVLLVENNDSTRLLITALLRNCGYEVVAVRNGKEAWKIIEDQTININLVLTEVVTPSLPGVDLLSKIRRHKISKHIPVIMMSSNDCMSTVVKCLSKGAVDFLLKPIRKNELKNLWQHVWRKCGTRRQEVFSREGEFADVIPDDPSGNHKTVDRSGPIMKRQRIEGDFTLRQSNFSAFTRYRPSTNSQTLVGNKEEEDMRSTDNNTFSKHEAEHYNHHTHNSSEAAEEQVQVQHHHYYHIHHNHHVHNNHHELLIRSANEQNSENYTSYSFSGSGSGNNSNSAAGGSGGPHQLTQREMALNRFRKKRKKRCVLS